jgi:hypothetical protein
MLEKKIGSAGKRVRYISALNARTANLDIRRINECKDAVWKSYEADSLSTKVAIIIKEESTKIHGFKSIGLRQLVRLTEFNAHDYYWTPYFSDVGRAIASGERKFIQEEILKQLSPVNQTISSLNPDFSILTKNIESLIENHVPPDIILAPIEVFVDFHKFFESRIDWTQGHPGFLVLGDTKLKVFWSHKYAPLNSFIIFNSNAAIWRAIVDQESGRLITIALGQSEKRHHFVEYWVETLVKYEIINPQAFSIVHLTSI